MSSTVSIRLEMNDGLAIVSLAQPARGGLPLRQGRQGRHQFVDLFDAGRAQRVRRGAHFELAAAQRFERLDHPQHLRRIGAEALLVAAEGLFAEVFPLAGIHPPSKFPRMTWREAMDRFGIEQVYGMHNGPGIPVGSFAIRSGPVMAATDSIDIRIEGLKRYSPSIINNLNQIKPGDEYSETALQAFQARLQDTGYFSGVDVSADMSALLDESIEAMTDEQKAAAPKPPASRPPPTRW